MAELIEKINNLKDKIIISIESLGYYSEFKYIKDILLNELNGYEYDLNDEMSLKKYYAWLQVFYENKIELINKSIIDNKNNSVFDNSTDNQMTRIHELEEEIENTLKTIKENYPEFSDSYITSYKKIKRYYQEQYNETKDNNKIKFNIDLSLTKELVLSLYKDIYSLINCYITRLENFNESLEDIKTIVENDRKIKKVFEEAYKEFSDGTVFEMIKRIESNYDLAIRESVKNDFSLVGPLKVQEITLNNCIKIEELTKNEIIKKEYYQKVCEMNLNTDNDTILDILKYVEDNKIFEEEFYYNLYAIIEKEKYLLLKYNSEPELYNSLSDKVKSKLEKMFIERLSEYSEEETTDIIDKLKKNGFIGTLDKKYQTFFNEHKFTSNTDYDLMEKGFVAYIHSDMGSDNMDNAVIIISEKKDIHFSDYKYKGDPTYSYRNVRRFFYDEDCFVYVMYELFSKYKRVIIDTTNRKLMKLPKNLLFPITHSLGHFIKFSDDIKNQLNFYDDKFNLVYSFDNVLRYHVDHRKEYFVLLTKDYLINIYDKNLKLIDTINLDLGKVNVVAVNDGILSIKLDNNIICYYDYLNKKMIDSFKNISDQESKYFIYSEGLYSYVDKNGLLGYKDIAGNVVIKPKYSETAPFLGNVAHVYLNGHNGFIDRTGTFIKEYDCYRKMFDNRVNDNKEDRIKAIWYYESFLTKYTSIPTYAIIDLTEEKYRIEFLESPKGYITAYNNYIIDINTPIKDIELNKGNSKVKK